MLQGENTMTRLKILSHIFVKFSWKLRNTLVSLFKNMDARVFLFLLMILPVSCRNENPGPRILQKPGGQEMAELNRYLIQKDREIIGNYIERKNLSMSESPTGLWYLIINEGKGDYLSEKDKITMHYECSLLDGTLCYSSSDTGPREIILGRTNIEAGLNEGLRMLRHGGEAHFILPPFLAYGLVGDGKKIPPRSIIVYKILLEN